MSAALLWPSTGSRVALKANMCQCGWGSAPAVHRPCGGVQEARQARPSPGRFSKAPLFAHPRLDIAFHDAHDLARSDSPTIASNSSRFSGGASMMNVPTSFISENTMSSPTRRFLCVRSREFAGGRIDVVAHLAEGVFRHRPGQPQLGRQLAAPQPDGLVALRIVVRRLEVFLNSGSRPGGMVSQHKIAQYMRTQDVKEPIHYTHQVKKDLQPPVEASFTTDFPPMASP